MGSSKKESRKNIEITEEQKEKAEKQIFEVSKTIDFFITEYSIELIISKYRKEELYVPPYQRNFIWDERSKSRFIESVIMGLPIPFLFFWENEEGKLEIVDGSQRIRTLESFERDEFSLTGLKKLTESNNFKFSDLSKSRQRKFGNRTIRGIVLNEHADAEARFDLFDRINTSGKAANPAEIRRGALTGLFTSLVENLSFDPEFQQLAPISTDSRLKREGEELISRFFAYGDGLDTFSDNPAEFIFHYTEKMNRLFLDRPNLMEDYSKRFHETMDFIKKFSKYGFRKSKSANTTPRTRFEALAIGTYLAIEENPDITKKQIDSAWLDSPEFIKVVTSGGANSKNSLLTRIKFVKDKLLGI